MNIYVLIKGIYPPIIKAGLLGNSRTLFMVDFPANHVGKRVNRGIT